MQRSFTSKRSKDLTNDAHGYAILLRFNAKHLLPAFRFVIKLETYLARYRSCGIATETLPTRCGALKVAARYIAATRVQTGELRKHGLSRKDGIVHITTALPDRGSSGAGCGIGLCPAYAAS